MHPSRSLLSKLLVAVTFLLETVTATYINVNQQQYILLDKGSTSTSRSWNFNFSSSASHYFASVQGLQQQWSNTFFPNGHAIVPCDIPPYTKFYHGRTDPDLPESPEWLSFDIEMAYGIMGSTRNSHMMTYHTTRPTKAIYFDGESATLIGAGRMDSQMLQIYLNTTGLPLDRHGRGGLAAEYDRAAGLCAWIKEKGLGGPGWGFEAIVRMNAGFEMIWCDFESPSLRIVSHLNVTAPLLPVVEDEMTSQIPKGSSIVEDFRRDTQEQGGVYETGYLPLPSGPTRTPVPAVPMPPPNWRRSEREPFLRSQGWGWATSAMQHYGFSGTGPGYGESRVKPLTCAIMNYYSPSFHSQALARAEIERKSLNLTYDGLWIGPGREGDREVALKELMRRRRSHRLDGVSVADASAMNSASEVAFSHLVNGTASCSGLDWAVLTNEIVQRHATELFNFLHLLSNFGQSLDLKNETEVRSGLAEIRSTSHSFLLPFLEYPGSCDDSETNNQKTSSELAQETYSRCRYHHTRLLSPEFIHLNPQETTLKWAVEETFGEICRTIINIGFSVETFWQPGNNKDLTVDLGEEVKWWREGIEELMSWLGWAGNWVRCEKKCEWDEKCFIPMWPMMGRNRSPGRGEGGPPPDGLDGRRPVPPEREDDGDDGEPRPPHRGDGRRPGRGGGGGRPPGWMVDESDLWKPKCVKADYIMGP